MQYSLNTPLADLIEFAVPCLFFAVLVTWTSQSRVLAQSAGQRDQTHQNLLPPLVAAFVVFALVPTLDRMVALDSAPSWHLVGASMQIIATIGLAVVTFRIARNISGAAIQLGFLLLLTVAGSLFLCLDF
jgi:hypothetical protein